MEKNARKYPFVRPKLFATQVKQGKEGKTADTGHADEAAPAPPAAAAGDACGSCYGAETVSGQCCNTCDEVREAYVPSILPFTRISTAFMFSFWRVGIGPKAGPLLSPCTLCNARKRAS